MAAHHLTIRRFGQYIHVVPRVARLDETFHTAYHKAADFVDPPPGILRIVDPLIWPRETVDGIQFWQAFAGLEPLIREFLERAGPKVVLRGKRPAPLPPPDVDRLGGLAPHDTTVLEFVRQYERGLIRYPGSGAVRPARLIAQIARAYPDLRIAVATTRLADARSIRAELAEFGIDCTRAGQVVGGTWLDLLEVKRILRRRDICIALNPDEVFSGFLNAGIEVVRRLDRARLYGLLAGNLRIPPRLRDFLTALFGVETIYVPKHGYCPLPVEALFVPMYGGSRPPPITGTGLCLSSRSCSTSLLTGPTCQPVPTWLVCVSWVSSRAR